MVLALHWLCKPQLTQGWMEQECPETQQKKIQKQKIFF